MSLFKRLSALVGDLISLSALTLVALAISSASFAETPLSEMQFFASHNAYQRSDPEELAWDSDTNVLTIADQLDRWNVWHMEWDLFYYQWIHTGQVDLNGDPIRNYLPEPWELWLGHTFLDPRGLGKFSDYLSQLAQTQRLRDGFVVIHFQMSDNLDSDLPGLNVFRGVAPDTLNFFGFETAIKDEILLQINAASVYTQDDFAADGFVWPSPEELVRRGKHVAFYLNRRTSPEFNRDPFFLKNGGRGSNMTDTAMWKLGTASEPSNPLVASYRFPEDVLELDVEWETAMANGHNFVGTTKLGQRRGDSRFHPPVPTYVDFTPALCGLGAPLCGQGTWLDRFGRNFASDQVLLLSAIQSVAQWGADNGKRSIIPIRAVSPLPIAPLELSAPDADYVLDTPIILINDTPDDLVLD